MVAGRIVLKYFVDREIELDTLRKNSEALLKGDFRNFAIVGPRRIGKTSLIRKHIEEMNSDRKFDKIIPVHINCQTALGWEDLTDRLLDTAFEAYIRKTKDRLVVKRISEWIGGRLSEVFERVERVEGELGAVAGQYFKMRVSMREEKVNVLSLVEKALWVLEELGEKKDVFLEVYLDEFQQVGKFDAFQDVLATMRDVFQHQKRVAYALSGSSVSFMQDIYTKESSAFFKQLATLSPGFLEEKDITEYLKVRRRPYDMEGAERLLFITRGIPDYMAKIVDEVERISAETVKEAFSDLIVKEAKTYAVIYESLTLTQQKILTSIARGETRYSDINKALGEEGLGAILSYMVMNGLLIKPAKGVYEVFDVGLKRYIQLLHENGM